jgi:hypothetical protein
MIADTLARRSAASLGRLHRGRAETEGIEESSHDGSICSGKPVPVAHVTPVLCH